MSGKERPARDLLAEIEVVLNENDRLRDLLAVLQAEKEQLQEHFLAARSELSGRLAEAERKIERLSLADQG
jgi:predicted  nucleic acid-binding Zn-ribbon protein